MKPAFSDIGNWFSDLSSNISGFFTRSVSDITDFFNGIPDFFASFWDKFLDFLKSIFIPEDGYFQSLADNYKSIIELKFPYSVYQQAFENLKDINDGDTAGLNVHIDNYKIGNNELSTGDNWINFDFILKYKEKWATWMRVFVWIFSLIYTINQITKILKGSTASDGSSLYKNNK